MIEKFFFTRAVGDRDYCLPGETCEFNDTAFYRISGTFWSIRCYGNVGTCFEIIDDFSEGRNTHLSIRSSDGTHIEEPYDPCDEFTISVTADEDLYGAPFFCKGHHEEPRVPKTDDKTGAF